MKRVESSSAPGRIDSHQHFWHYSAKDFPWIGETMLPLKRDYLPGDLAPQLQKAGVTGTVAVQARHSLEETDFLLQLAAQNEFIQGVVGWVPLTSPAVSDDLARVTRKLRLKGVRHIVHDEPDDNYILRDDFNRGLRALEPYHLVYDILIFERHLEQTIRFVDLHPHQQFVVDHIAKPRIREGSYSPWAERMARLAQRENVACKFSGVVTEANWKTWNTEQLRPYFDAVLRAFGPRRLMFGSDWPVLTVAGTYERWVTTVEQLTAKLTPHEQEEIWGGTAKRVYKL